MKSGGAQLQQFMLQGHLLMKLVFIGGNHATAGNGW